MKPGLSPELLRTVLRILGGASTAVGVGIAIVNAILTNNWQTAIPVLIAALGGGGIGTTILGPGHVDVQTLPKDIRDSIRPPKQSGQ